MSKDSSNCKIDNVEQGEVKGKIEITATENSFFSSWILNFLLINRL